MGKVIPLPRVPWSWTSREYEIFARIGRFYNRSNLVKSFADVIEGKTDEGEPWIAYMRQDGDSILSITKIRAGARANYVIKFRSHIYEFEELESFTEDFIVETMWAEGGSRR
ncbi:MAG: hypothetical protein RIB59_00685 [Rhodospirillales bacterium]